jgi:hypothetical protein
MELNASRVAQRRLAERTVIQGDAVMFDIDDTLWRPTTGELIQPILDLLYTARMLGYRIIIITARPPDPNNKLWTMNQLHQMGVIPDETLYCMPQVKDDAKEAMVQQRGLRFILSVGDQWTDLGATKWWLKLPDNNDHRLLTNMPTH